MTGDDERHREVLLEGGRVLIHDGFGERGSCAGTDRWETETTAQRTSRRATRGRERFSADGRDEDGCSHDCARSSRNAARPPAAAGAAAARSPQKRLVGTADIETRRKPRLPLDTSFRTRTRPPRSSTSRDAAFASSAAVPNPRAEKYFLSIDRGSGGSTCRPSSTARVFALPAKYPRLDRYHRRVPRSTSISLRSRASFANDRASWPTLDRRRPRCRDSTVRSRLTSSPPPAQRRHARHGRVGDSPTCANDTHVIRKSTYVLAQSSAHQKFTHQRAASSAGARRSPPRLFHRLELRSSRRAV